MPLVRQRTLFGSTLREPPKDAETVNHRLLTQAGFVDQLMAGVYSYLPLGLRVLNAISSVVREEMNAVGGQEILMPMLHPKSIWQTTGAWETVDVLFKIRSRTEKEYALGQSEEEVVTPLVLKRVQTYKDLPQAVYQIHWKFRDELRAKSGILRGKEFLMKDLYSFHENAEDFERFFAVMKEAYLRIFTRFGLTARATEASGGSFSQKISTEFMVLTDAGEDDILFCSHCSYCVNVEIATVKEGDRCPRCPEGTLARATASEVGNVFDLGQKYGKDFQLSFLDREGTKQYPMIGCYGIGMTRLMGVLVEAFHDDKGIVWPSAAAPFQVHVLSLRRDEDAGALAEELSREGFSVLLDDRPLSAGEKLTDSELIGIPAHVILSERGKNAGTLELRPRAALDRAESLAADDRTALTARLRDIIGRPNA